jgi:hypothetical protein
MPTGAAAERCSQQRAWRSQSSLKKKRQAGDRNATGEMTGCASRGPRESRAPLSTRRRAPAGVWATSDAWATRDGCRASAGRHPGEGRPKLLQRCPAPARAIRRTRRGVTAGVRPLRMCRLLFEHAWAHSQGGHPREARDGEVSTGHEAGRRDARRWPRTYDDDERHTPPQGGEPERRRDERRT